VQSLASLAATIVFPECETHTRNRKNNGRALLCNVALFFDYGALRTPRNCWGRIRTRCLYGRCGVLLGARVFIDFSGWLHHMGVAQGCSKRVVLGRLDGANRSGRALRLRRDC
jgi:hypothetical protein